MNLYRKHKGNVLFTIMLLVFVLSATSVAYLTLSESNKKYTNESLGLEKAQSAAEAGVQYATMLLTSFRGKEEDLEAYMNDKIAAAKNTGLDDKSHFFELDIEYNHDDFLYNVTSTGHYAGHYKKAILTTITGYNVSEVFFHAVFAGNKDLLSNGRHTEGTMTFGGCPHCGGTGTRQYDGKNRYKCTHSHYHKDVTITVGTWNWNPTWYPGEVRRSTPYVRYCGKYRTGAVSSSGHSWKTKSNDWTSCSASTCGRDQNIKTGHNCWQPKGQPAWRCYYQNPWEYHRHIYCKNKCNKYETSGTWPKGWLPCTHSRWRDTRQYSYSTHSAGKDSCSNVEQTTHTYYISSSKQFRRCRCAKKEDKQDNLYWHERCYYYCWKDGSQYKRKCSHNWEWNGSKRLATYNDPDNYKNHGHGCPRSQKSGSFAFWSDSYNGYIRCNYDRGGDYFRHQQCNNNCRAHYKSGNDWVLIDGENSYRICYKCNGTGYQGTYEPPKEKQCEYCNWHGRNDASRDLITGNVYNYGNIELTNSALIQYTEENGEKKDDGYARAADIHNETIDPDGTITYLDSVVSLSNVNSGNVDQNGLSTNVKDPTPGDGNNENIRDNYDPIAPPNIAAMEYDKKAEVNAPGGNTFLYDPDNKYNGGGEQGQYINVNNEFDQNTLEKIQVTDPEPGFKDGSTIDTVPKTSPASILARDAYKDIDTYSILDPNETQNWTAEQKEAWKKRQYFTMDLGSGLNNGKCTNGGENILIENKINNKVFYIEGNLWIESSGKGPSFKIKEAPNSEVKITYVVLGNIYVCDATYYNNNSGIAFLAISGGKETYMDMNGNGKFDSSEDIILNDGGVKGTYEGQPEGTGNVFFGDPSSNTGVPTSMENFTTAKICWGDNDTNNAKDSSNEFKGDPMNEFRGFLYAENDFLDNSLTYDFVRKGNGSIDTTVLNVPPFTVRGMYCAGNRMQINRDFTFGKTKDGQNITAFQNHDMYGKNFHAPMRVIYNHKLYQLKLPGLPKEARRPSKWFVRGMKTVKAK